METNHPRVVILGAGFGGLAAARALAGAEAAVTVVDRNNHHLFQPLLYQVATAGLAATDIAAPIRAILRGQANAEVVMGEVTGIDLGARKVAVDARHLPFDYLVVATGAVTTYFGKPEWEVHAPGLKDLGDALRIRERVLLAFERAELAAAEGDAELAAALLTFVVVGGGPTGVEVAGSIAELARRSLTRDFRAIDPASARIILIEGGPRPLAAFPESLSRAAAARLARMGVQVRVGERVGAVDAEGVAVKKGAESLAVKKGAEPAIEHIRARTVVWAAGVAASPVARWLGGGARFAADRAGRVKVQPDLTLPGEPRVFVIGDAAWCEQEGRPLPGLAPVALQQGRYAGQRVRELISGGAGASPFRYRDKGNLATVGRSFAVADVGGLKLSGRLAWLTWVVVHIAYLISFHNRLLVLFEWAWAYMTWQRGARLITGRPGGDRKAAPALPLQ